MACGVAALMAVAPAWSADTREQALRAMAAADWAQAVQAWRQAEGPGLAGYRSQVQAELQYQQVEPLLAAAQAARQRENWQAADDAYRKVLAADNYVKTAHQGRAQIRPYLIAHRELAALRAAGNPYDPVLQARIQQWLTRLDTHKLKDRKLLAARQEFSALLKAAKIPVQLTLTSDGKSDLEIYGVGRLGRVTRKVLSLPPGDYTAIASRPGFRDARTKIKLRPGQAVTHDMRCTEPIR